MDYIVVDTLRVPRETFAQIVEAWRDGYAGIIGETTPISSARAAVYQPNDRQYPRPRTLMLYRWPRASGTYAKTDFRRPLIEGKWHIQQTQIH